MKIFYAVLVNTLIANITTNFVWFALIFWSYLETHSVLATSISSGIFLTATALSGFWFGSIVDHHKKKTALMVSGIASLVFFSLGLIFFMLNPHDVFTTVELPYLWILILFLLFGVVAGNIRMITIPTLTTILVPEKNRDKANGIVGMVTGITFAVTSVASGLAVGYLGMLGVLVIAVIAMILSLMHLSYIEIHEKGIVHIEGAEKKIDIPGTIAAIKAVPGLFGLIFFTMFNNFLGGVFMSLMDAYGLSLVSVQTWGFMFGVLSFGFIAGGLYIAKKGLGKNPLKSLFAANIIMWTVAIFFTAQPSIVLLGAGIFIWICLSPFVEAAEHTIIQKVVPINRQGRVFGFAQSIEQTASPLTAFIIGPVAQFIFIPFMTTGAGVDLIGSWYGIGEARGIALVFSAAGCIGLVATIVARQSHAYRVLSEKYALHHTDSDSSA